MSDIYVITRHWDNDEVYGECLEQDEYPFRAFSTYEDALEYLKHELSNDDIVGDLIKWYYIDDVTPFDPVEGKHYGGVWYKCINLDNRMDKYNIRFIIYNVKMGDTKDEKRSQTTGNGHC